MSWHTDWRSEMQEVRPRRAEVPLLPGTQALGAWGIDPAARYLGTDRKTLLLIGISGLVVGWLAHNASQAAGRGVRRARRRVFGVGENPRALMAIAGAGLALGAAYWYYRKHPGMFSGPAHTAAPVQRPASTAKPAGGVPKLVNGHWVRP